MLIVPWAKVFFGMDFLGGRSLSWKLKHPVSMWGLSLDLVTVNLTLGLVFF